MSVCVPDDAMCEVATLTDSIQQQPPSSAPAVPLLVGIMGRGLVSFFTAVYLCELHTIKSLSFLQHDCVVHLGMHLSETGSLMERARALSIRISFSTSAAL